MAFYDRFVELCQIKGEKPSPILKKLNISSGNLKRWKDGAGANPETLKSLSDYFCVPISYFFDEDDEPSVEWVKSGNSLKEVYSSLKSHPDYIASVLNGFDKNLPKYSDYERISDYMHIDMRYLMTAEQYCRLIKMPENERVSKHSNIPPKDMVLSILGKMSAGEEYKFLQVRLSMVILNHLMIMGITPEQLEDTLLPKQKIYELGDIGIAEKKKKSYTFSDLCKLSEELNISFDCMLSGRENSSCYI